MAVVVSSPSKPFVHRLSSGFESAEKAILPHGEIVPEQTLVAGVEFDPKAVADWPLLNQRDGLSEQSISERKLVVSPYVTEDHLLDLDTVSMPCQILAKALSVMRATRPDYATAPYNDSFNWSAVIDKVRKLLQEESDFHWPEQESFYIVAFRSQIPPSTDRSHLGDLDEISHAEAMAGGGLLKYWFGRADSTGRNLATCVWRNIEDSRRGSTGKGHKQATRETRALYTEWKIDRLRLDIGPGAEKWDIVNWVD